MLLTIFRIKCFYKLSLENKKSSWVESSIIAKEETLELDVIANQEFIASLTEMVWTQLAIAYCIVLYLSVLYIWLQR